MEHKKRNITGLTFLIMGVIVLVIGIIAVNNTDMSKYKSESSLGKRVDSTQEYNADGIKNIKLDLGISDYTVVFDESADKITVKSANFPEKGASTSADGDTFEYRANENNIISWNGFNFHLFDIDFSRIADMKSPTDISKLWEEDDSSVVITIPAKAYNDIKIGCGVGNTALSGKVSCDDLKINCGVGNLKLDGFSADTAKLEGGVGNIKGEGVSFGDLKIEAGMGNIDLKGFVGDTKINCGVGNIDLTIKGSRNDYDIDEDEADIHGSGTSNGGSYTIKVESGLGDCDIYFE